MINPTYIACVWSQYLLTILEYYCTSSEQQVNAEDHGVEVVNAIVICVQGGCDVVDRASC